MCHLACWHAISIGTAAAAPVSYFIPDIFMSLSVVSSLPVCAVIAMCTAGGFMRRAVQGTLEYMAPEVLQKQPASAASDVYALAITINELATGKGGVAC